MPGFLLHVGAVVTCPHQGPATTPPTQPQVLVSGMPVATTANLYVVAGCIFTLPGPVPSPCVTIQWSAPATRVLVNGMPALVSIEGPAPGLCLSALSAPQGPPLVSTVQSRVFGV